MHGNLSNQQLPSDQSLLPFNKLLGISTQAATPIEESLENIRYNVKQGYPRLFMLPEFQKVKGPDKPIAIIAGGPSVKRYPDDIRQFKTSIVCGSANDWAMGNGIIPTYAAICDPDPVSINYYSKLDTETKYLVASCCSPKIFEHLKGKQVVLWHCHSDEQGEEIKKLETDVPYFGIGGGCTVGLRALSISIMCGYTNTHMFGFDSCLADDDEHHAYNFSSEEEGLGKIYNIRLGDQDKMQDNGRIFKVAGYQLAQAEHFREFWLAHKEYFTPVVYGDGMIATMLASWIKEGKRLEQENK